MKTELEMVIPAGKGCCKKLLNEVQMMEDAKVTRALWMVCAEFVVLPKMQDESESVFL